MEGIANTVIIALREACDPSAACGGSRFWLVSYLTSDGHKVYLNAVIDAFAR